jgi:hypothetical protein
MPAIQALSFPGFSACDGGAAWPVAWLGNHATAIVTSIEPTRRGGASRRMIVEMLLVVIGFSNRMTPVLPSSQPILHVSHLSACYFQIFPVR